MRQQDRIEHESKKKERGQENYFKRILSGRVSPKFTSIEFENKNHPSSGLSYVILIKKIGVNGLGFPTVAFLFARSCSNGTNCCSIIYRGYIDFLSVFGLLGWLLGRPRNWCCAPM